MWENISPDMRAKCFPLPNVYMAVKSWWGLGGSIYHRLPATGAEEVKIYSLIDSFIFFQQTN